jgi:hypothetical protein
VWTGIQFLIECTFNAIDTHLMRLSRALLRDSMGLQSNFVEIPIECSILLKNNKTRLSVEEAVKTIQKVSNAFQSYLMGLTNIQCF